jgi:hypothetical protein
VHILRLLVIRELLMLLVITGLGAGPASLLSKRFGAVERVALAPVLGICLGTSVFTTLLYFWPASETSWLVPVLAVASVVVAVDRSRRTLRWTLVRANLAGWASLGLIIVVVSVPILSVMRSHHTVGPVSYAVGDAVGYVAEIDGEVRESLHHAAHQTGLIRNLSQGYMAHYTQSYQNLDLAPLQANVNSLVGLGSTDSWVAFLIAFVVAGALGAAASVRWVLREGRALPATLSGTVAGVMFGGALLAQLFFADSQAALGGLALLLPLGAVAADAVEDPRPATLVVLAGLISGLLATYPLFVISVAVAGAAAVLWLAVSRWRSDRTTARAALVRGAVLIALMLALAFVLNLVSFTRDLRYYRELLTGGLNPTLFGFPVFDMQGPSVPAWLLQTRDLFELMPLGHASLVVIAEEVVLPVALIGVIVVALKRAPMLGFLLIAIAVAALLGEYEALKNNCSYCTDRSLLPIGPLLIGMFAIGLGALWMSRRWVLRAIGLVVLVGWAVAAFTAERDVRDRVTGAGAFLSSSARVVLADLPKGATVDVEGFDAAPGFASPTEPFAYELADERSQGRATLPDDISDFNALAYFGISPLDGGAFNPDYEYVLTRIPGIKTSRRTISRSGGIALQKRTQPVDVTVDGGLAAPTDNLDEAGVAWVLNATPLRLVVAGGGSVPEFVGVRMIASVPTSVSAQPDLAWHRRGSNLTVCVRAQGTAPARLAQFQINYTPVEVTPPGHPPYLEPPYETGVQLAAVAVAPGRCPSAAQLR